MLIESREVAVKAWRLRNPCILCLNATRLPKRERSRPVSSEVPSRPVSFAQTERGGLLSRKTAAKTAGLFFSPFSNSRNFRKPKKRAAARGEKSLELGNSGKGNRRVPIHFRVNTPPSNKPGRCRNGVGVYLFTNTAALQFFRAKLIRRSFGGVSDGYSVFNNNSPTVSSAQDTFKKLDAPQCRVLKY